MIHRKLTLPALLAVVTLAAGCQLLGVEPRSEADVEHVSLAAADTFDIVYGQTIEIDKTGLRLTFEDVQEGRCPADVKCVWEGEVTVSFWARKDGRDERFDLTLPNRPTGRDSTTVFNHTIRLERVEPYPLHFSNPPRKAAYRAYLTASEHIIF